eukprot:4393251-Pleurochrysis_carterae.AAC.3
MYIIKLEYLVFGKACHHKFFVSLSRIGASVWLPGPLATRRSPTLAGAAIPGVCMAKPFAARAHAILNELGDQNHI